MIPPWSLYLTHWLDYGATLLLLGSVVFDQFILREEWNVRRIRILFILACITSSSWMILSAIDMADSLEFSPIWFAMSKTNFSHWWCYRVLVLLIGALILSFTKITRLHKVLLLIMVSSIPIFSSLVGHPAMSETHVTIRVALDFFHTFGASIWLGGLYCLYHYLGNFAYSKEPITASAFPTVERFSHFAMASTGTIMVSGLVQIYLVNDSLFILWSSEYGKLAFLKLLLFCTALLAAAVNQFKHMAKWKPGNEPHFARRIRREVRIEMLIIVGILIITSFLTRTNLPGS